jgi:hypothetical protein
MLEPSLYALYKQGRFRKSGLDPQTEEGMKQVERFAVAMLGFALKHDLSFRKSFLLQVCNCQCGDAIDPTLFLIELEVAGCGDLILRKEDNSEVYALEFKVGADLQDHNQNPSKLQFFTSGYGKNIRAKYGPNSTYIVVQNERSDFGKIPEKEPSCIGKSWADIYSCPHGDLLICDLFQSFGALGITEFMRMNTKGLSLGRAALDAAKLHTLLEAVAKVEGFKSEDVEAQLQPNDQSYYVKWFSAAGARQSKWNTLIQPKNKRLGSFGYTNYGGPALEVWFECGTREAADKTLRLLKDRFPNDEVGNDPENHTWIVRAKESLDDQEWFISVFDSLVHRT